MLAGRQPKVASVYQSYCGLSVSQCLITVQKGIMPSLSSLQLGSISLLSVILKLTYTSVYIHETINIFEEVDFIWVQCNYIKCIFCTHVFTKGTKQLRSLISLFFYPSWLNLSVYVSWYVCNNTKGFLRVHGFLFQLLTVLYYWCDLFSYNIILTRLKNK